MGERRDGVALNPCDCIGRSDFHAEAHCRSGYPDSPWSTLFKLTFMLSMFRDNFMHPVAVHLPTCMLYGELPMQLKYADMAISAHALTMLASYANRIMELFNAICAFLVW